MSILGTLFVTSRLASSMLFLEWDAAFWAHRSEPSILHGIYGSMLPDDHRYAAIVVLLDGSIHHGPLAHAVGTLSLYDDCSRRPILPSAIGWSSTQFLVHLVPTNRAQSLRFRYADGCSDHPDSLPNRTGHPSFCQMHNMFLCSGLGSLPSILTTC